jgi:hypothetical protein
MPGSMEFLRAVLGIIGIGCAYMAARAFVAARKGWGKQSRVTGWLIRTVLCLAGMVFRHTVDVLDITVWILVVVAVATAWWVAARPRQQEDLTGTIFHDEQ